MSHRNGREALRRGESAPPPGPDTLRSLTRRRQVVVASIAVGGLFLAPQALPASAQQVEGSGVGLTSATVPSAAAAPLPPDGMTWFEGVVTDQAGHPLNNVNVEAWNSDPSDIGPVASNLSYAGDPADGRHQSGVFRLEVPGGAGYRITLSTVSGREDGDPYRMQVYGGGRLVMARTSAATAAVLAATPGRVVALGTVRLARLGTAGSVRRAASTTIARLVKARITVGHRARLQVRVTSRPAGTHVTGAVRAKIGRRIAQANLGSGGRVTIRLPKVKRGKHAVQVTFLGSSTVAPSKAKPVRLTVKRKR